MSEKFDFSEIAFLVVIRLEVKSRIINLKAVIEFYKRYCSNTQFIIVEDSYKQNVFPEALGLSEEDIYYHHKNASYFAKSKSFNVGSRQTKRPILLALDTDVIVHPEYILEGTARVKEEKIALFVPHNGVAFYLEEHVKIDFLQDNSYETLLKYMPETIEYQKRNENLKIAELKSIGGCVLFDHEQFIETGGFNPNFYGWGPEDKEIYDRFIKLERKVIRTENKDAVLWHLPHPGSLRFWQNPRYWKNIWLYKIKFKAMNKTQLEKYVLTWRDKEFVAKTKNPCPVWYRIRRVWYLFVSWSWFHLKIHYLVEKSYTFLRSCYRFFFRK